MACVRFAAVCMLSYSRSVCVQDDLETFVDRVDGIVRKKLHYDSKLLFGPEPTAQRELLQELDRCVAVTQ